MRDREGTTVLELRDVTKTYRQGTVDVVALRGLNLTIGRGEFTAICGPSGSGKTTLLNIFGALDVPTSGNIAVEGVELGTLSRRALSRIRRDRIGFVFQSYNLIPVLTAYENAGMVMALQGAKHVERNQRVADLFAEVGLEGLGHRRPYQLSGGQQQRVAIVRAIASNPAVVLADEPTANVDSATADHLLSIMEKLNRNRGVTFVFSTHDARVMDRARRLVSLVDGRIAGDELRTDPEGPMKPDRS